VHVLVNVRLLRVQRPKGALHKVLDINRRWL